MNLCLPRSPEPPPTNDGPPLPHHGVIDFSLQFILACELRRQAIAADCAGSLPPGPPAPCPLPLAPRAPSPGPRPDPTLVLLRSGLSALLGLPENLGDVLDLGEQGVGDGRVGAALGASGARELGGVVEQLVQLRVLLEVRRLEVVGPQHPQVVFDQVGAFFLDVY